MNIAVAISGGIDSFYCLKWGLENFENITAVFLNFIDNKEQINKVIKIGEFFKIPLKIFDVQQDFKKEIVDYFTEEYFRGRTPNPCIKCNEIFKFKYIFEKGYKKIITGHYANIIQINNNFYIAKGKDVSKEQSYFLARIKKEFLPNIIFPLGEKSKYEVENIIKKNYSNIFFNTKQSQEICFIPNNDYKNFIQKKVDISKYKNGKIINSKGKVIGYHNGFFNFTIGQRKGLNIAMGKPYYVLKIDPNKNIIYAGPIEETFHSSFEIEKSYWFDDFKKFSDLRVKVRYRTEEKSCKISGNNVILLDKENSVTPGQLAVFYSNNNVIGSGWIKNAS